jgi:ABC-type bacteriocin/lantibiotic exporter with double-glycine peptidase domain
VVVSRGNNLGLLLALSPPHHKKSYVVLHETTYEIADVYQYTFSKDHKKSGMNNFLNIWGSNQTSTPIIFYMLFENFYLRILTILISVIMKIVIRIEDVAQLVEYYIFF